MKLRELESLLHEQGWDLSRQNGSHRVYRDVYGTQITFSVHSANGYEIAPAVLHTLSSKMESALEQRRLAIARAEGNHYDQRTQPSVQPTAAAAVIRPPSTSLPTTPNDGGARDMRTCARCGTQRPLTEYWPVNKKRPELRQTVCSACMRETLAHARTLARRGTRGEAQRQRILDLLRQHPEGLSAPAIGADLGIARSNIYFQLAQLNRGGDPAFRHDSETHRYFLRATDGAAPDMSLSPTPVDADDVTAELVTVDEWVALDHRPSALFDDSTGVLMVWCGDQIHVMSTTGAGIGQPLPLAAIRLFARNLRGTLLW